MVKISIILAHPSKDSFNHAIAAAAADELLGHGHDVTLHDLYAEGFAPLLPSGEIAGEPNDPAVQQHCIELAAAEGIVIVHPNWWGMPPAILKGWVDRVFRAGVAYDFVEGDSGEGVPVGLLKAKEAVVFNTSNTARERELRVFGDPLETLWRNCIFNLCGVRSVRRCMFETIITSTIEQRQAWLEETRRIVGEAFPRLPLSHRSLP